MKVMPTWSQNGAEIDAKSDHRSMPKQVANKIMEIIKFMFLLYVRPCKFIVKTNNVFLLIFGAKRRGPRCKEMFSLYIVAAKKSLGGHEKWLKMEVQTAL